MLLLLLLLLASLATADNTSDLLLAFKASFDNGNEVLSSWTAATEPCGGTWKGVNCVAGVVTQMYLGRLGLRGSIPEPSGWPLPEGLNILDLTYNNLSSSIPPAMRLPSTQLSWSLDGNQLTGALPPLALPPKFLALTIDANRLTALPKSWTLPATLGSLSLQGNLLTGPLPTWIGLPEGLRYLMLSNNNFSGSIPDDWALPSAKFTRLGLHGNSLTGTLPSWPNLVATYVTVTPGNPGLCGMVPPSPRYVDSSLSRLINGSLASCAGSPPAPDNESERSSTAAIVGGVVGGVCGAVARWRTAINPVCLLLMPGAVLLVALSWWLLRHRRRSSHPDMEIGAAGVQANGKGSSGDDVRISSNGDSSNRSQEEVRQGILGGDALLASIMARLGQGPGSDSTATARADENKETSARGSAVHVSGMHAQWHVPFKDLRLIRLCGRGSFGRVYLATYHETSVAVKLLLGPDIAGEPDMDVAAKKVLSADNPVLAHLKQEASMMAALRHPNILAFIGWCEEPPCLVMEHCPRGSLFDALKKARTSPAAAQELTWAVRLKMALETAKGMNHLHSRTPALVHRDLKSPNLLIGPNYQIKICDFNLSKLLGEASLLGSASVVNPRWAAPEVLQGATHTFASDVYSFGVVLWELLSGRVPFEDTSNFWKVSQLLVGGQRPAIPSAECVLGGGFDGLQDYIQLMSRCWAARPQDRPAFSEIVPELRRLLAAAVGYPNAARAPAASAGSGGSQASMDSAGGGAPAAPMLNLPQRDSEASGVPIKSVRLPDWTAR